MFTKFIHAEEEICSPTLRPKLVQGISSKLRKSSSLSETMTELAPVIGVDLVVIRFYHTRSFYSVPHCLSHVTVLPVIFLGPIYSVQCCELNVICLAHDTVFITYLF